MKRNNDRKRYFGFLPSSYTIFSHPLSMRCFWLVMLLWTTASAARAQQSLLATSETQQLSQMRGACYATWQTPDIFLTPASDAQLRRLKEAGLNTIALRVAWSQEGYNTWEIAPNFATPTADAIGHVVRECHRLGMKVMLALMVDFADDNRGGSWHYWGQLAPGDKETDEDGKAVSAAEGWKRWFASYEKFLLKYAQVAQDSGADLLCIGNEFATATKYEKEWRDLIAKTRAIYKGPLTYQAMSFNVLEYQSIKFWDALDYIGMNGYWKLSDAPNPSREELEAALQKQRDVLRAWHGKLPEKMKKPILFTEVGYHSADGTASHPWERNSLKSLPNPDLQARCFEAFLNTFSGEPWLAGIFWWAECPPGEWGMDDRGAGHPFLGKPAEAVLRRFSVTG
jgi:hypothetical protein